MFALSITRSRPVRRRVIAVSCALISCAVLAGCSSPGRTMSPSSPTQSTAAVPATPPPGTVVMLIRHGEKPDTANPGFDQDGNPDSSSLTEAGYARARNLIGVFDPPPPSSARPGIARPHAIYAASATDTGNGLRTRETVAPLAQQLGIQVNTGFGKGDEAALVADAISHPGPTLICWQHGEIPAIADEFDNVSPAPPSDWPDDRYDMVWTFTRTPDGWSFAQVPELASPGDQTAPIQD